MHQAIVTTRERANDSLTTRESVLSPRKVRVCDAACAFLMELAMGGEMSDGMGVQQLVGLSGVIILVGKVGSEGMRVATDLATEMPPVGRGLANDEHM
uniref:CheB-type methylesterase domain-containing protein n=1 Tax=Panagrellus redivivus TaxID=6233 RepID=A0A7E4ZX29_PANRE